MRNTRVCVVASSIISLVAALGVSAAPPSTAPAPRQDLVKKTYIYKTVGELKIQADVYRPDDGLPRPVVVYLHGGALMFGGRADLVTNIGLLELCKAEGYIFISPDYRLAPEAKLPQITEDLRDFMKWVREKGPALFGADAGRIVVTGQSAGGYLALMTGLDPVPPKAIVSCWGYGDIDGPWYSQPSDSHRKRQLVPKDEAAKAVSPTVLTATEHQTDAQRAVNRVRGRLYLYYRQNGMWTKEVTGFNPANETKKLDPYCPVRNVTGKYPPTILIHGEIDSDVPCQKSLDMAAQFKLKGVKHELITVRNADHMLARGDKRLVDQAFARAREFIKTNIGAAPASPPASAPAIADDIKKVWPFGAREAAKRQEDAAKSLGVKKEITLSLSDKASMKFTLVPAGRFVMGSARKEQEMSIALAKKSGAWEYADPANEGPQHEVTLTQPFYMGTCPVTRGEFAAFVADSGYQTVAEKGGTVYSWNGKALGRVEGASWKKPGFDQTDDHPVVLVTHSDALAFCAWLSKKTGRTITLPTEAQWEWACRAGSAAAYFWGDSPDDGKPFCNAADQSMANPQKDGRFSWNDGYPFTSPVGKFKPSALGLFDMQGNAKQWCLDIFDGKYYTDSVVVDPPGPKSGDAHVLRGSGWSGGPSFCRSAVRGMYSGDRCDATHGFRVICADVQRE